MTALNHISLLDQGLFQFLYRPLMPKVSQLLCRHVDKSQECHPSQEHKFRHHLQHIPHHQHTRINLNHLLNQCLHHQAGSPHRGILHHSSLKMHLLVHRQTFNHITTTVPYRPSHILLVIQQHVADHFSSLTLRTHSAYWCYCFSSTFPHGHLHIDLTRPSSHEH